MARKSPRMAQKRGYKEQRCNRHQDNRSAMSDREVQQRDEGIQLRWITTWVCIRRPRFLLYEVSRFQNDLHPSKQIVAAPEKSPQLPLLVLLISFSFCSKTELSHSGWRSMNHSLRVTENESLTQGDGARNTHSGWWSTIHLLKVTEHESLALNDVVGKSARSEWMIRSEGRCEVLKQVA